MLDWIIDLLLSIWCLLQQFFYWIVNNVLTILDYILQFVLVILPDTPFEFKQLEWGILGHSIGYFIPVATIISHFIGILTCISIYYGVRYLLRLIRQVG